VLGSDGMVANRLPTETNNNSSAQHISHT